MKKNYSLVIKPGVINDTQLEYDWYEEQSHGLGERFLQELEECYMSIETHPTAFSRVYKSYRKAVLKKFPYLVLYTISNSEIIVFAVFHGKRNPKNRLKRG